jgi:hypothetical protein
MDPLENNYFTSWLESASELYRPSDLRLSAILVPTFTDRGCHVVSVTDPLRPYSRLSRPEPLPFISSSSSVVLTMLNGPRSRPRKSGSSGNRTRTSGSLTTRSHKRSNWDCKGLISWGDKICVHSTATRPGNAACYPMDIWTDFLGRKVAEAWSSPLTSIQCPAFSQFLHGLMLIYIAQGHTLLLLPSKL